MNAGCTIFAQVVALLSRQAFASAVRRYRGQAYGQRFSCMDQLLCMIFAQLTTRSSLGHARFSGRGQKMASW